MLTEKEIRKEARERYNHCSTMWAEVHRKTTDIFQFIAGNQWTDQARQNFENAGYAAMTSNRLPTYLRQITNEIRKNTPEIQIDPRNDENKDKAEMLNDLIRNIQDESKAEIAYCTAAENAASVGIGYIRVLSKYVKDDSMDQEIVIESIKDPNTVMIDPHHLAIDGSDSDYGFISTEISKDDYLRRYGKTKLARKLSGNETKDDFQQNLEEASWSSGGKKWMDKNQILICEYYFKDYVTKTLYQIIENTTGEISTTFDLDKEMVELGLITVLQERLVNEPIVRWCKINDLEILEQSEWPGKHIPIVVVKGDEFWIENKRKLVGAVEPAIEAQVQLNYAMSWRAQLLQMAPKAPYIGTAAQFKTYEQEWANLNVSNQAFLTYNKDDGAPPPQRDLGEIPIQASTVMVEQAQEDLKSIFGTFDPSNQEIAPESGKAILARQAQSFNSNYHFYDNLARSIQHVGCIIVDAIPVIYDSSRTVLTQSIDGKKKAVAINQPNEEGVVEYDLSEGDYTVSIQTGPSFGTKRQETAEAVMGLISVYPQAAQAVADIAVRHMDWPGSKQIADSLEAMVPPQILQARKTNPKDAAAMVPQLQAQLQAVTQQLQVLGQQHQQLVEALHVANDKSQLEQLKIQVDADKNNKADALARKKLELEEQETELEYVVKETELKIAMEELKLKRTQLGLEGVKVASDINEGIHEHAMAHIDRVSPSVPEDANTGMQEDLK